MKNKLSHSLLFLFFILFSGLSFPENGFSEKGQRYQNAEHFFSMTFPAGWIIEKGKSPPVVVKAHDKSKFFSASVTVFKPGTKVHDGEITDFMTSSGLMEEFRGRGADTCLIDSGVIRFRQRKALWAVYMMAISNSEKTAYTMNWQIMTLRGGNFYSISFGAGDETMHMASQKFERMHQEFEKILASFNFEAFLKYDYGN